MTASGRDRARWELRDDRKLSSTAKLVWLMLDTRGADPRPSKATLAGDCGLDKRTIDRAIDKLAAAGWLRVHDRRAEAGDADTNVYELTCPAGHGGGGTVPPPSGTDTPGGYTSATTPVAQDQGGGGTEIPTVGTPAPPEDLKGRPKGRPKGSALARVVAEAFADATDAERAAIVDYAKKIARYSPAGYVQRFIDDGDTATLYIRACIDQDQPEAVEDRSDHNCWDDPRYAPPIGDGEDNCRGCGWNGDFAGSHKPGCPDSRFVPGWHTDKWGRDRMGWYTPETMAHLGARGEWEAS